MRRRGYGGFTLVELMIVVVIIGVLAVLAITGYRKYTYAARNAEAVQFLGGVRAAQQAYFEAFGRYCGDPDPDAWPPRMPTMETGKEMWQQNGQPIPANNAWSALGIQSPGRVWFQYSIAAGGPNDPDESGAISQRNRDWFWAQANGDFNNDGVHSTFEVTSEKPDVFIANENE
ncbi:MAG: prepilin-type N-terminal cleavage/methylation domain-containing protein [Myxococcota bacterium]|nr:prepilin-type N-terminal cleavage/methylation domain-containing protein [Myxococcota bacterium]